MREELKPCERYILYSAGHMFRAFAAKHLADGCLQSYQMATLLMLMHHFDFLSMADFAILRYDLAANHVVVEDIADEVLKVIGCTKTEDKFFLDDATKDIRTNISQSLFSTRWPKYFRSTVKFCFEDANLFSILNFVCGCQYWDAYAMYRLLIGKRVVLLNDTIILDSNIDPTYYLPDVPKTDDELFDYIESFKKIMKYFPNVSGKVEKLTINVQDLAGLLSSNMFELAGDLEEAAGVYRFRLAEKLRKSYLHLTDLSTGKDAIEASFYDFGVCV